MSHIATVDLEIRDLDALAEAAQRCGVELVRGQTRYRWYGTSVGDTPLPEGFATADLGHCQHVLRVPGNAKAYEVGVVSRRDGRPGYVLHWDFYAGGYGLQDHIGVNCGKLKQAYGLAVARRQLTRQGFTVQEQPQPDGSISLVTVGGRGAL